MKNCVTDTCYEYSFQDDSELKSNSFKGSYGVYPNQGYMVDFDSNRENNVKKIDILKKAHWIDHDTRCL